MDPHLLPHAERQAPRYTSYPSANHFDTSVDAKIYDGWLRALGPSSALSLYLHIPYCRQLCWYCGCNTGAANKRHRLSSYVDALHRDDARSRLEEVRAVLHTAVEIVPNFHLFVPGRRALTVGLVEHGGVWPYVGQTLLYATAYAALLLVLASLIFRRRDFL